MARQMKKLTRDVAKVCQSCSKKDVWNRFNIDIMMSDQFHVHNKEFKKCSFPKDLSICNMHMKVLISTTHFLLCSTINETHINFKFGTMIIWSLQQMT
jgi:hypothetical protein